jgi:hypothetical protein
MCNFSGGAVGLRLHDADGVIFNNVLFVEFNQPFDHHYRKVTTLCLTYMCIKNLTFKLLGSYHAF